jgi:hypothetical protein
MVLALCQDPGFIRRMVCEGGVDDCTSLPSLPTILCTLKVVETSALAARCASGNQPIRPGNNTQHLADCAAYAALETYSTVTAKTLCNMPGYQCFAEAQMLMGRRRFDV